MAPWGQAVDINETMASASQWELNDPKTLLLEPLGSRWVLAGRRRRVCLCRQHTRLGSYAVHIVSAEAIVYHYTASDAWARTMADGKLLCMTAVVLFTRGEQWTDVHSGLVSAKTDARDREHTTRPCRTFCHPAPTNCLHSYSQLAVFRCMSRSMHRGHANR